MTRGVTKIGYDGGMDAHRATLGPTNPFARAIMPRECVGCGLTKDPESYPLPTFASDGHYIVPNVCLACHAEAERNRRIAAEESTV